MKIPTIDETMNGVAIKRNGESSIFQIAEKEDLNTLFKTEWEFVPIDEEFTDKITRNQCFFDWIDDHFPLLHTLEYELEIWTHGTDPISKFDGNYFFVAKRFDNQQIMIARYRGIGTFAIGEYDAQPTPEAALKYVEQVSA